MNLFLVRTDNVRFSDERDTMTYSICATSVKDLLEQICIIYKLTNNLQCFQFWTAPLGSMRIRIDTLSQNEFDTLPKECNVYIRYVKPTNN
jgi:hypothetical protein